MRFPLKAALSDALKSNDLTNNDRGHLTEWMMDHPADHDSMWQRIVADADARRVWPRGTALRTIIWYALASRRYAEAIRFRDDPIRQERQRQRDELLVLAQKADDLAGYYRRAERYSGIAT